MKRYEMKRDSCIVNVEAGDVAKWEKAGYQKTGKSADVPASKTGSLESAQAQAAAKPKAAKSAPKKKT